MRKRGAPQDAESRRRRNRFAPPPLGNEPPGSAGGSCGEEVARARFWLTDCLGQNRNSSPSEYIQRLSRSLTSNFSASSRTPRWPPKMTTAPAP